MTNPTVRFEANHSETLAIKRYLEAARIDTQSQMDSLVKQRADKVEEVNSRRKGNVIRIDDKLGDIQARIAQEVLALEQDYITKVYSAKLIITYLTQLIDTITTMLDQPPIDYDEAKRLHDNGAWNI